MSVGAEIYGNVQVVQNISGDTQSAQNVSGSLSPA